MLDRKHNLNLTALNRGNVFFFFSLSLVLLFLGDLPYQEATGHYSTRPNLKTNKKLRPHVPPPLPPINPFFSALNVRVLTFQCTRKVKAISTAIEQITSLDSAANSTRLFYVSGRAQSSLCSEKITKCTLVSSPPPPLPPCLQYAYFLPCI